MQISERQRVLVDTSATRAAAQRALEELLDARSTCERHLNGENRRDAMKVVTGTSSMDAAIDSTRRMLERLDRALDEAKRRLTPSELAAIEALERESGPVVVGAGA